MSRRTYIIVFDASDPDLDFASVAEYIKDSPDFSAWWQHLPYVFLVTSELDAGGIRTKLRQHAGEARFLVMAADPGDSDGWLRKKSWEWIKKRARAVSRPDHDGK